MKIQLYQVQYVGKCTLVSDWQRDAFEILYFTPNWENKLLLFERNKKKRYKTSLDIQGDKG